MRYLFNMGLSGSIFCLVYWGMRPLLCKTLSPKWRCLIGKCILLYYLIPLTPLKSFYRSLAARWKWKAGLPSEAVHIDSDRSLMVYWGGKWHMNTVFRWELTLGAIWLGVGVMVFLGMAAGYLRQKKRLDCCAVIGLLPDHTAFEELKRRYGIRRRVLYLDSTPADREGRTAFTVGILRPLICYPEGRADDKELIVEHELVHIRHGDLIWRMFAAFACVLHCINPLVWYLKRELELLSEMHCDECVLRGRDDETRRHYAEILYEMLQKPEKGRFVVAMGQKAKDIKERMEMIMRKREKIWGNTISVVMVIIAVVMNSFTVLAYQDVQKWDDSEEHWELLKPGNDLMFCSNELLGEAGGPFLSEADREAMEILYDDQFISEEGGIYPILEEGAAVSYAACQHQYEDGRAMRHVRNSAGGCTITYYQAQRCSLCGKTIYGEVLSSVTWTPCPH